MERIRHGQIVKRETLAPIEYPPLVAALDAEGAAHRRWVYMLVDPRELNLARYIGCSIVVGERYRKHIIEARNPHGYSNPRKVLFIQQLLCDGVFPEMLLIEELAPDADFVAREAYWIEKFRSPDLTNFDRPAPTCSYEKADSNPGAVHFFRRSQ